MSLVPQPDEEEARELLRIRLQVIRVATALVPTGIVASSIIAATADSKAVQLVALAILGRLVFAVTNVWRRVFERWPKEPVMGTARKREPDEPPPDS